MSDAEPGTAPADQVLAGKERALGRILSDLASVVVAFSGGADSTYLAYAANKVLGRDRVLCVTGQSPSYPEHHRLAALDLGRTLGLRHEFIVTGEMDLAEYRANPPDRCYYCKRELFTNLARMAGERGLRAVVDGNNADDRGDYRPGRRAAREFGVRSPLDEAALSKAEIRQLSCLAGLPTWDQPASACLSSRIPHHTEITPERLRTIEQAENLLRDLGFRVCRVRHHGETARLEIGADEMARVLDGEVRSALIRGIRALGFRYVALDLEGYRTGSLNVV